MELAVSHHTYPGRTRVSGLLKFLIAALTIAVMCGVAFGETPSNASLKGTYSFNFSVSKEAYWSKSKTCTHNNVTNTYWVNAQTTYTELNYGTATFDGAGHVTLNMNDAHQFDQAASDASISITCAAGGGVNSNSGQLVYSPLSTSKISGTYSVSSNGSGSITLPDGGGSVEINVGAVGSNGISTTFLMRSPPSDDNLGTGMAVLQ